MTRNAALLELKYFVKNGNDKDKNSPANIGIQIQTKAFRVVFEWPEQKKWVKEVSDKLLGTVDWPEQNGLAKQKGRNKKIPGKLRSPERRLLVRSVLNR